MSNTLRAREMGETCSSCLDYLELESSWICNNSGSDHYCHMIGANHPSCLDFQQEKEEE